MTPKGAKKFNPRFRLATDRQTAYMEHLGIDYPVDCTVEQASALISERENDVERFYEDRHIMDIDQ